MKKGRNTAEILGSDVEFNNAELSKSRGEERTLILKAAPRSRKGELIAKGAKEIRCIYCRQIKPLVRAEESERGWTCEDCALEMTQEPKCAG
jgi:hypothetical protein